MEQSETTMNHRPNSKAVRCHQLALRYLKENNFGLALGNLLLVVKLCPEQEADLQDMVAYCLGKVSLYLENASRHEELLRIYESVLEVYPSCAKTINALGEYLLRHGHVLQSAAHFLRASRADGQLIVARDNLDRANAQLVDRWHFTMLNDRARNTAYHGALRAAVGRLSERDLVLDVGAGTGLLSMMAVEAGASAVYACEGDDVMCQVAAAVLADNGMQGRVRLMNKWSRQLSVGGDLPRRAALLVTETFDAGLLGEHVLSTLDHAWRHLLLPPAEDGGVRVVPAAATVWAAAVESDHLRRQLTCPLPAGGRLRRRLRAPYWSEQLAHAPGGYRLLSEPVPVYAVNFNDPADIALGLTGLRARHVIRCTAVGRLDALVTWFELQLCDGETLSSAPGCDSCWEQAVYPVSAELSVRPGQTLVLETVCRGHLQLRLADLPPRPEQAGSACTSDPPATSGSAVTGSAAAESAVTGSAVTGSAVTGSAVTGSAAAVTPRAELTVTGSVLQTVVSTETTDGTEDETGAEADAAVIAFVNDSRQVAELKAVVERWLAGRPGQGRPRLLDLCPVPVGGQSGTDDGAGPWDGVLCAPVLPSGRLDPAVLRTVRSVSLAPGGLLWPARLQLLAVLVSSRLVHHMTSVLRANTRPFDCDAINMFRVHQLQDFPYTSRSLSSDLSDVTCIGHLDLATGAVRTPEFSIPVTCAGLMHGLVYWFRPIDGRSVGPELPQCGRQMVAALVVPRPVQPGHCVTGSVHPTADGVYVVIEDG